MELAFLRGATIIVSDGKRRIICDPWLEDGIYYGAWAHYPPFTAEEWRRYKVADVDYIYISHIHPDHFDPNTLKHFKGQKVIIHKFLKSFLKRRIEALGFEVVELENGHTFNMGNGFGIRVFAADDCDPTKCGRFFKCTPGIRSSQIDSLAVITTPKATLVNVNDCPWALGKDLAAKIGNDYKVDIASIAYGLAGAWPQCFRMRDVEREAHARARAVAGLHHGAGWAQALKTKKVLPFAGDYQLCGKLSDRNEHRGIPEIETAISVLRQLGLEPIGNELKSEGRLAYVWKELSERKLDYEDDPFPQQQELISLLKPAHERYDKARKEYEYIARNTAYIKLGEKYWYVIPPVEPPYFIEGNPAGADWFAIECDPRLLKRLLSGPKFAHWNNAEIGSHLTLTRTGNPEWGMALLLSYFHA